MITSDRLTSFRLGPKAVQAVFTRDIDSNANRKLPASLFGWTFEGLARTEMVPAVDTTSALMKWAEQCLGLDIEPVLVIAAGETFCSEDDMADLRDTGVTIIDVPSPDDPEARDLPAPDDDEWTVERLVALPDPGVVEAYYSTTTTRPVSAWPLHSDLGFWVAYGEALTRWARSGDFRIGECSHLYFSELAKDTKLSLQRDDVRWIDDPEFLGEFYSANGQVQPEKVVSTLHLPFTFDVLRNGVWQSFGRLPGVDVGLRPLSVSISAKMQEVLRSVPDLAERFAKLVKEHCNPLEEGALPGSVRQEFDLLVIESEHRDFPLSTGEDSIGTLSVGPAAWIVSLPWVRLRDQERVCGVRFHGFVDASTGAAVTLEVTVPAAREDDFPRTTVEVVFPSGKYEKAADIRDALRIDLLLDEYTIVCAVRPR